jgi:hypothetical protein
MDIHNNTSCYSFIEINFENGIFDETVDCTYIIHLVGNGRLNHIYSEINKINTTKKIIIVMNKGYKKCNKKLIEQQPYQDLTDAFLQCLKNAKSKGFKNILILEDDFIFDNKLKDKTHATNINRFMKTNKNNEYVYFIGVIPIIIYPTNYIHTFNVVKSLTMHSVIYSEQIIQNYDKLDLSYKHWDVIIDKNIKNKYAYFTPLCYQTFPETENKKTWSEKDNSVIINEIKNKFIKFFNMDKIPDKGFKFCYYLSFFIFIFISIFFLLFIIITLIYVMKKIKLLTNYKFLNVKYKL